MNNKIQSASDSAKKKIRDALHSLSDELMASGRNYNGLDHTVYILYAIECFMRALSQSPYGKDFVLKGGNLFRIWDDMTSFRPTSDLDLQCARTEDVEAIDIRSEVARIVDNDEFRNSTGLTFPLEEFKVERLRHGYLKTYRMDGLAILGDDSTWNGHAARIPFCLEVVYGPAPENAVTIENWKPITSGEPGFNVLASRPEWMAAEKFHSIVSRGAANSRLKDYRDLSVLLSFSRFDNQMFHRCIREVFQQLQQSHLIPETPHGIAGLSTSFANSQNESIWTKRRWKEWEGREWERGRDPELSEIIVRIVAGLEEKGVFHETPARHASECIRDMVMMADNLADDQPDISTVSRFAALTRRLVGLVRAASPDDVNWFWGGFARECGLAGSSASDAIQKVILRLERVGLLDLVEKRCEGVGELKGLMALQKNPTAHQARNVAGDTDGHGDVKPKRRGRKPTEAMTDRNLFEEGLTMLREGRPGTHVWFGGLARVLKLREHSRPEDAMEFTLTLPEDERLPYIWIQIAKKQGLNADLRQAVSEANEVISGPSEGASLRPF